MFPDAGCQNKRKLCLCDSVCGLSCVRPEKECPELPDPEDGQVHLTGRHFQVRGPVLTVAGGNCGHYCQDRAVYTCDQGHRLVGVDKVVCQTSGQWSGAPPRCTKTHHQGDTLASSAL